MCSASTACAQVRSQSVLLRKEIRRPLLLPRRDGLPPAERLPCHLKSSCKRPRKLLSSNVNDVTFLERLKVSLA
jgi:hypothetical protein